MALTHNRATILRLLAFASGSGLSAKEIADEMGGNRSSIYLALTDLQQYRLIDARWDTSGSYARKIFSITAIGESALREVSKSRPIYQRRLAVEGGR